MNSKVHPPFLEQIKRTSRHIKENIKEFFLMRLDAFPFVSRRISTFLLIRLPDFS